MSQALLPFEFLLDFVRAWMIRFVDYENVGDLHDAGFEGLDVVAYARHQNDDGDRRDFGDFDFRLADAYGLHHDYVPACSAEEAYELGCGFCQPAQGAACGHGADEDARIGVMRLHADAV